MKQKRSITTLVRGIEVVLWKCRASLTAKEADLLVEAIDLLEQIEDNQNEREDRFLILLLIIQLAKIITHPEVFDTIKNSFDHLHRLL